MERKECANGLQLIKVAAKKLRGNFSAVFMGAFAMTTPLILSLFLGILLSILFNSSIPFTIGLVLFVVFVAPLQMGYMKYFNNVLDGKQPRISEVYSYVKFSAHTLRAIYISGLLMIMYIIGGVLWLVPAGFAISFYSMTLFFLQKFEYPRMTVAMKECSKMMIGNRLAMFSYKLIFYLVYMMLFVVAGLCFALIYTLLVDSFMISWLVAVCSAIVFIFMYTMVTVYFHSCNQIFFEDVLTRNEKRKRSKVVTSMNATDHVESLSEKVSKDEKVEFAQIEAKDSKENTKTIEDNKQSSEEQIEQKQAKTKKKISKEPKKEKLKQPKKTKSKEKETSKPKKTKASDKTEKTEETKTE